MSPGRRAANCPGTDGSKSDSQDKQLPSHHEYLRHCKQRSEAKRLLVIMGYNAFMMGIRVKQTI